MDDYYELLGVDSDAPVDDIRAAYRDKRAAATANEKDADRAKAEAAALNKAWNVLSDPYQRGRYDQQRANADDSDADEDDDDTESDTPVRRRPEKATARADARRKGREPVKPTVTLPAGMAFPTTRRRITAMFIDLAILLVLFIGSQILAVHLEKSAHPTVYKEVTALNSDKGPLSISLAHSATSKAGKTSSAADKAYANLVTTKGKNAPDTLNALDTKHTADAAEAKAKAAETKLTDRLNADTSTLAPIQNVVSGGFFFLSLLILLVPSLFGGQTLGKRQQRIRVVRVDGSRARAADIFRRYVVLVFAAYVISTFLRSPVGALIVVFVATMWTRNPNQQALHDRFAKTLVVTDSDT